MLRLSAAAVLALIALGCAGRGQPPAPPPPPIEVFEAGLTPAALKNRIAVRGFKFEAGDSPSVTAALENLLVSTPVVVEFCVEFRDGRGITQVTPWTRATIPASRRHQILAETTQKQSTSGRILLRILQG